MQYCRGLLARLCAFAILLTKARGDRVAMQTAESDPGSNKQVMEQYAAAVIKKIEKEQFQEKLGKWADGWEEQAAHGHALNLTNFLVQVEDLILKPELDRHNYSRMVDAGELGRTAVIGDIHGQLWVLLPILKQIRDDWFKKTFEARFTHKDSALFVCHEKLHYVFLGDYVDRGDRNLHTFLLPLAYKVLCPKQVTLLQGNHEQIDTNIRYGFQDHCQDLFSTTDGLSMHGTINRLFQHLPFVATVEGAFIVTHGGLTEDFVGACTNTRTKGNFQRCLTYDMGLEMVWSDPSSLEGWDDSPRGMGSLFGPDIVDKFLGAHYLKKLIRGHQMERKGIRTEQGNPNVLTVFSAADYTGTYSTKKFGNDGGWIYIDHNVEADDFLLIDGGDGWTHDMKLEQRTLNPDEIRKVSKEIYEGNFLELAGSEASMGVHEHWARMEVGDRQRGVQGNKTAAVPSECKEVEGRAEHKVLVNSSLHQAFNEDGEAGLAFKAQEMVDECGEAVSKSMPELCEALAMDAVVLDVFSDISKASNKIEVLKTLQEAMSARVKLFMS